MDARSGSTKPKECDLIMKGGITSGVVYTRAVLALKHEYRFRNIGGGSVGAVAAALTAAAELGRNIGGFVRFEQAQEKLKEEDFLLKVFRPPNTYKPLMDTALAFASLLDSEEREKLGKVGLFRKSKSILRRGNPRAYRKGRMQGAAVGLIGGALVGVLFGVLLYLLFAVVVGLTGSSPDGVGLVLPFLLLAPALLLGASLGLLCAWLGGPVWAAYDLFRLATKKMPEDNFYGFVYRQRGTRNTRAAVAHRLAERPVR